MCHPRLGSECTDRGASRYVSNGTGVQRERAPIHLRVAATDLTTS